MELQSTVDYTNTTGNTGTSAEQQDWEPPSCISTAGLELWVTCAGDLSKLHAEDKAGLVSLSFSLLHHVHRETPALDAILVQDLDRCLVGVGWFLVIKAASIIFINSEWKPQLFFFAKMAVTYLFTSYYFDSLHPKQMSPMGDNKA